jgi:predicted Fe-Mo cluster-binding NifX family protein
MRIAIPTWRGRVSPVFDVARRLLLVDSENGQPVRQEEVALEEAGLTARAGRLVELAADVLICGAISRPLEAMLVAAGVRVIPQTCGPVEQVLRAFVSGQMTDEAFLMPGCCGRRRRLRRRGRGGGPRPGLQGGAT